MAANYCSYEFFERQIKIERCPAAAHTFRRNSHFPGMRLHAASDRSGPTDFVNVRQIHEAECIIEVQCWSIAELESTNEMVFPEDLVSELWFL